MDLTRRDLLRAGALGAAGLTFGVALAADEFDTVILHGDVIDPESRTRRKRNLGLRGGRIVAISEKELRGKRTIDARGLVVAPGFIETAMTVQLAERLGADYEQWKAEIAASVPAVSHTGN